MRPNILVIFTGGTIGSAADGSYIAPSAEKPYALLEWYKSNYNTDVVFHTQAPYTLLSENLTGTYISQLMRCVAGGIREGYDGIIVTHGTDTLQYAAAAVGYLTGASGIPVVFVSSNYVLEDERANGRDNFCCAVDFIRRKEGHGTFLAYRNRDGITYMHRASRALPYLPYDDEIFSLFGQYYGYYREGTFIKNKDYQAIPDGKQGGAQFLCVSLSDVSAVFRVFPYPGMAYPPAVPDCRAILLDTYHAGTICNLTPGIEQFFDRVYRAGIPVYRVGATVGMDYESVKEMEKYHIKTLPQISPAAAYMKIWLLLEGEEELLFCSRGEDVVPKLNN